MGNALNVPIIITVKRGKDATKTHVYLLVKWKMTVNQRTTVILIINVVSTNVNQMKIANMDIDVKMVNVCKLVVHTIHV